MEALTPAEIPSRRADFVLLDTRDDSAFAAGHLAGSGHVPDADLAERRGELPPRDVAVLVVATDGPAAVASAQRLAQMGYARVAWLDAPLSRTEGGLADRSPAARLWRPSPFLERVLPLLPPPGAAGRVLDLAAGAGREAVFLALHGYQVEAWDHDRDVLERARRLAARHGVAIATVARDLERHEPGLPDGDRGLVMAFRFLHRPLFPHIARSVAPGGCVVYETYLSGQERFGRPTHPRFLLDPGELPRHFPGFEIEIHQESAPPEGPCMARLLARKPG